MGRLLVIEHGGYAPVGLFGDWAAERALALHTVALHAGDRLPGDLAGYDGVVSLGSAHAAYDDTVPWLAGELSLLARAVAAEVPVFGICFGAQALARVLGARVFPLPEPEIRWARLASNSPALAEGPWLAWHYDAFELPPGAAPLASTDVALQAYSLGPHAGVQFHPEATRPIAESWLAVTSPRPGATDPLFRAPGAPAAWARAAGLAPGLFSAWFDGKLTGA